MSAAKVKSQNNPQVSYNASGHSFSGWLGGKSQLARTIINMMPEHKHYCEVFAGAAWVLFKKTPSYSETINDINGDLINLYRVFKFHPDALLKELELQLISRDEFYRLRSEKNTSLTDIQRAARFYYLLRNCYGARIEGPTFASHVTRPANMKLGDDLKDALMQIHQRLQRVTIENQNFEQMLLQKDHVDTLFYLDPPYYNCEKYYGKDIFSRDDFLKLRDLLSNIKGKFILSLNNVPEVREIFKDFYFTEAKIRWSIKATSENPNNGQELIITNFKTD